MRGRTFGGKDLCDPLEREVEGRERAAGGSRWTATKLRIRLGYYMWRRRGRGEYLQLVYLLPWVDWQLFLT